MTLKINKASFIFKKKLKDFWSWNDQLQELLEPSEYI
jgi:hypothetical protein